MLLIWLQLIIQLAVLFDGFNSATPARKKPIERSELVGSSVNVPKNFPLNARDSSALATLNRAPTVEGSTGPNNFDSFNDIIFHQGDLNTVGKGGNESPTVFNLNWLPERDKNYSATVTLRSENISFEVRLQNSASYPQRVKGHLYVYNLSGTNKSNPVPVSPSSSSTASANVFKANSQPIDIQSQELNTILSKMAEEVITNPNQLKLNDAIFMLSNFPYIFSYPTPFIVIEDAITRDINMMSYMITKFISIIEHWKEGKPDEWNRLATELVKLNRDNPTYFKLLQRIKDTYTGKKRITKRNIGKVFNLCLDYIN